MDTDRQAILLAVLKARGPAHPRDLAYHPALLDRFGPALSRYHIEDDLEALLDVGEVVAYLADVSGEPATVAYDVVGAERTDWDRRFERAERAHREGLRRRARNRRTSRI